MPTSDTDEPIELNQWRIGTPEQLARWRLAAKARGMTLREWIPAALDTEAMHEEEQDVLVERIQRMLDGEARAGCPHSVVRRADDGWRCDRCQLRMRKP